MGKTRFKLILVRLPIEIVQQILGYDEVLEKLVIHIFSPELIMKFYCVVRD